ncbi:hypothetical protein QZH41_018118 [Actinostola sp. cb2023]|nr:hypothetical protein QZH41_018118 [Actinostola sp. cb2023]
MVAAMKLQTPTDKQGVERLNGAVNYLAKFLPKLSQVMAPIRQLTHKDVEWHWDAVQDRAFEEIKQLVTQAPVLAYYDPQKELVIQCDASSKGLGAVLLQEERPVAYASRCLTDAETRYATIEKEMLAVVFALEKWHQFTYGRAVQVCTDHKPLVSINQKSLDKAPRRLQGMLLRSLNYNIDIQYRPGKEQHLADMMSRSFLPLNSHESQEEFEVINAVKFLPMREERIQEIKKHTESDDTLCQLRTTIQQGFPTDKLSMPPQLTPYFHMRDELSVYNGLVFSLRSPAQRKKGGEERGRGGEGKEEEGTGEERSPPFPPLPLSSPLLFFPAPGYAGYLVFKGDRLVIPKSMRKSIKKELHSSHSGIDGCLRRARESVYWPGMSSEIKEWISTCETCREYETAQPKEPLMSHEIPERPWEKVGIDILTFQGTDYLVTVDYYSNYWEIDRLENTKSATAIRKLKAHFARFGIPSILVSDNGPQFTSDSFRKFTRDWDIEHTPSAPYNSQSNGKAEAAVKAAKKMLRKTQKTREDQYLALLAIRNTPSQGIGRSPIQRIMNRRTRTLLPTTDTLLTPKTVERETEITRIKDQQERQAFYFNRNAHKLTPLQQGDTVRMKPFSLGDRKWQKATVKQRLDDRSYEVENTAGTTFRRNRVHLNKTNETRPQESNQNKEQEPVSTMSNEDNSPHQVDDTVEEPGHQQCMVTRSGRIVKRPAYLADYTT